LYITGFAPGILLVARNCADTTTARRLPGTGGVRIGSFQHEVTHTITTAKLKAGTDANGTLALYQLSYRRLPDDVDSNHKHPD